MKNARVPDSPVRHDESVTTQNGERDSKLVYRYEGSVKANECTRTGVTIPTEECSNNTTCLFIIRRKTSVQHVKGFKKNPDHASTDKMKEEYASHLAEKEACCKEHREDQKKPAETDYFICASFDLQKVLNTPCGNSVLLYYSRKYAVYNLTVYEFHSCIGTCNLWEEVEGQRGAVEIGTCLYRWLRSTVQREKKPKHIVMFCDCCPEQNRNRFIVAMLLYAIKHLDVHTLELKFLISGHTYMQVYSL